ncbi:MAG: hypothetical protein K940chlam9_00522, partial [Chlamydiae bacterium]|nr:hypothetical protein [Chlamydiota bacterium]
MSYNDGTINSNSKTVKILDNNIADNENKKIGEEGGKGNLCARGIRRNFGGKAMLPTAIAIGVLLVAGIVLGLYLFKVGPIYTGINSGATFIQHNVAAVVVGAGAALGLASLVGLAINYVMTTKKWYGDTKGADKLPLLQRFRIVVLKMDADPGSSKKDTILSTAALVAIALTITAVVLYATNTAHMQTAINSYMGNHAVA